MSKGKKRSGARPGRPQPLRGTKDRKSGSAGMPRPISYAVFCLKKKKKETKNVWDVTDAYRMTQAHSSSSVMQSHLLLFMRPRPLKSTLFPYTTLFRSTLTFLLTQKKTCVKNYVQKE